MSDLLSIGRFSELTGLTVKALRLYDKRGLLRPAMVDFASGYRYYSPDQVRAAERIRLLRSVHMTLSDIEKMLSTNKPDVVQGYLTQHRKHITERLTDYRRVLKRFPTVEEWCESTRKESSMSDSGVYQCSFCKKGEAEVRRMIAGPGGVYICNECVTLCNEVIAREEAGEAEAKA